MEEWLAHFNEQVDPWDRSKRSDTMSLLQPYSFCVKLIMVLIMLYVDPLIAGSMVLSSTVEEVNMCCIMLEYYV